MANPQMPAAANLTLGRPVRRIVAMGIDGAVIVVWAAGLAVVSVLFGTTRFELPAVAWDLMAFLTLVGPVVVLFAVQEASSRHATAGKRRLGLRVVTADGVPPTLGRTLVRSATKFLPWQIAHTAVFHLAAGTTNGTFLVLAVAAQVAVAASVLMMFLDREHRAFHDIVARTRVVTSAPRIG